MEHDAKQRAEERAARERRERRNATARARRVTKRAERVAALGAIKERARAARAAEPYHMTARAVADCFGRAPEPRDEYRAGWYVRVNDEPRGPFASEQEARTLGALHPELAAAVRSGHTGEQRADLVRGAIARGLLHTFGAVAILSIDAWRDGSAWTWNNWHTVGYFPLRLIDLKPRAMLRELRARGYLTAQSAGRVALDDDGHNVTVQARGTREPIFAIEYGSAY